MFPVPAFVFIKKNVEDIFFNPNTKLQIIGCLPLFCGIDAGWKPITPSLGKL